MSVGGYCCGPIPLAVEPI